MPLDGFECIENLPWDEYSFSRQAFTTPGGLYGLPTNIYLFAWAVNENLAREMGIALPEYGWTWDDFFAMADEVERYNAENGTEWLLLSDNSFLIPSLFQQYGCENNDIWNGAANYTDEYFIELADKWLSAYQRGLVGKSDDWDFETVEKRVVYVVCLHFPLCVKR